MPSRSSSMATRTLSGPTAQSLDAVNEVSNITINGYDVELFQFSTWTLGAAPYRSTLSLKF